MLGEFLPRSMQEIIPAVTPDSPANWRMDSPYRFHNIWIRFAASLSMILCSLIINFQRQRRSVYSDSGFDLVAFSLRTALPGVGLVVAGDVLGFRVPG